MILNRITTAMIVAASLVSGCGVWFGEDETPLAGDRIALRTAPEQRLSEAGRVAAVPGARQVGAWPQAGGDPTRTVGNASGAISLRRLWSVSVGDGSDSESRVTAAPVASGQAVYALDAASQVTAVSHDGKRLWRTELTPEDEDGRDGFGGGMAVAGGMLIVGTGFGEVLGLDAGSGAIKWRQPTGSPVRSAPALREGLAVFVTRDGAVIAYDYANGTEAWRSYGLEGRAGMLGGAGPAISGEVVAAPFASGDVAIFRLSDGRRGWSEPLGASMRGAALALISDISSAPVMNEGVIYAGGISGRIIALEIPTGRRVWARDIGSYNPVWVAGSVVYVMSQDARILALDSQTGDTIWQTQLPQFEDPEDREDAFAYGGPIMVGGKLLVTSSGGELYRIDAASGAVETKVGIGGGSSIAPIFANGRLYVLDEDADLHAFQ